MVYFLTPFAWDNDLFVHLLTGRLIDTTGMIPAVDTWSFTAFNHPWINHEWLSELLLWLLYKVNGEIGLILYGSILPLVSALIMMLLSRKNSSSWAGIFLVGAICIAAMARGFSIRPQLISYLLLPLCIAVSMSSISPLRKTICFAAIITFWANCHGGFLAGLGFAALHFANAFILERRGSTLVFLILVPLFLIGASFINPWGPGLFQYLIDEISYPHPITEWLPIKLQSLDHFPFFVTTLLLVASFQASKRANLLHIWVSAIAFSALAFTSQRHVPVAVIFSWIPITILIAGVLDGFWRNSSAGFSAVIFLSLIAITTVQVFSVSQRNLSSLEINKDDFPIDASKFLSTYKCEMNIAAPLGWGAFLLFEANYRSLYDAKISLDGRFLMMYPGEIVQLNEGFFALEPGSERLLTDFPTNVVIAPHGLSIPVLAQRNENSLNWERAYSDPTADLWIRSDILPCSSKIS